MALEPVAGLFSHDDKESDMADFGRDEIDDALDGAPEIDDDSVIDDDLATPDDGEAFIGRDDSAPAPNRDRRPAEVKNVRDDGGDSDSDSDTGDGTAGVERDGDESLREIAADIRRLDDSDPRPSELHTTEAETEIATTTVAAAVLVAAAVGVGAYVVAGTGALAVVTLVGVGA